MSRFQLLAQAITIPSEVTQGGGWVLGAFASVICFLFRLRDKERSAELARTVTEKDANAARIFLLDGQIKALTENHAAELKGLTEQHAEEVRTLNEALRTEIKANTHALYVARTRLAYAQGDVPSLPPSKEVLDAQFDEEFADDTTGVHQGMNSHFRKELLAPSPRPKSLPPVPAKPAPTVSQQPRQPRQPQRVVEVNEPRPRRPMGSRSGEER